MESEKVVIFEDELEEHTWWVVEGDWEDPNDDPRQAIFIGPMAKSRAEEYVALKSRISSLEAALSLNDENVERVAKAVYRSLDIYFPSKKEIVLRETAACIRALRRLAGLEVSDE